MLRGVSRAIFFTGKHMLGICLDNSQSTVDWIFMTEYQAEILFVVVRTARRNGWRVPTGEKLSQLLYENKVNRKDGTNKKIVGRTANDHIKRLRDIEGCFEKRGNYLYIKPEKVATESQTALFFLLADKVAATDPQGYIHKERLQRLYLLIQSKLNLGSAFDVLFNFACDEGYLEELPVTPDLVRIGFRTREQERYLELLIPDWDLGALLEEFNQIDRERWWHAGC